MKSENLKIRPLIVHPPPEPEESIGKWIERLAKANNIRFDILFGYIFELCGYCGFYKTLSLLTRVPVETISKMEDEFKDSFWNDQTSCPIKRCEFSTNSHKEIVRHLKTYHDIGVIYYTCSMCDFKTRDKQFLTGKNVASKINEIDDILEKCKNNNARQGNTMILELRKDSYKSKSQDLSNEKVDDE